MQYIKNFFMFWYDFIVGDDWIIALGVVIGLVTTHWLVQNRTNAWWFMPVAVGFLLMISLARETVKTRPRL